MQLFIYFLQIPPLRHVITLLMLLTFTLCVQAQNTIVSHPNARLFPRIWYVEGDDTEFAGHAIGGLWDIYGTGTNAWTVKIGAAWNIYNGFTGDHARDTIPVQKIIPGRAYLGPDRIQPFPIIGDFWGTGSKAIGFIKIIATQKPHYYYSTIQIHRTESKQIDTVPAAIMTDDTRQFTMFETEFQSVAAIDLDNDGDDELIIPWGHHFPASGQGGELWIYEGGQQFQVGTPTHILNTSITGPISTYSGDFDGDNNIDLVMTNPVSPAYLMFYFGDGTLTGYSKPKNQRYVSLDMAAALPGILDCDGDGILDIVTSGMSEGNSINFFRSGTGKNPRTRSYTSSDVDNAFTGISAEAVRGGYLNDSTGRFDMTILISATMVRALSGGINGPDNRYDAYYESPGNHGWIVTPLADINGDGWDDVLIGDLYYGPYSNGTGRVLGGGPEIPQDPIAGVESLRDENHEAAISTWPNPVRNELNIAWRGDLKRMPHQFLIHDISGREIARGTVDPGHGAALWKCDDVAPGTYLLDILDMAGRLIATQQVIKCE